MSLKIINITIPSENVLPDIIHSFSPEENYIMLKIGCECLSEGRKGVTNLSNVEIYKKIEDEFKGEKKDIESFESDYVLIILLLGNDYLPKIGLDPKVALVKYHPGYDPKIFENLIDNGYKAIIFEGTGLGHVGRTMYDVIKKAKNQNIFLGMTSQCMDGKVNMAVYESMNN